MRDKLNKDPKYQIGLVVLLLLVAFLMLKGMGGGGSESSEEAGTTEATVSVAGTEASATATGESAGEAVEVAAEGAIEEAASEGTTAAVPTSIPTPPLPAPVAHAYDSGQTVALLIVHDGGIDDRLVKDSTEALEGFPGVTTFIVPAKQIARYSAVTLGVDVTQVPALVVMRPKHLSGGIPQATVSYGFQTQQGIEQALRDASYDGPAVTYHPE